MPESSNTLRELDRLACPVCHAKLLAQTDAVACSGCGRRYPIVDGIPVLIPSRAVEKPQFVTSQEPR